MIREPKNKNEETFLKKFGEKEFDAIISYEDDLYSRKIDLMNEMNKEENKKELNSIIKNFCSILANDKSNALNPLYAEIIEKEKELFPLNFRYSISQYTKNEDNYCDTWHMIGYSNPLSLFSLKNIIEGIYLSCTHSRMCIDSTPLTSGMRGAFNTLTTDYQTKENLVYFYAQISLVIETSNDKEISIPILDLFFGDDEKKWLIQINREKDCSDIPFYPNVVSTAKIKED